MISFLSPLFLAGAAAAAIPLVLHLLKREPEPRVMFAAVKLLKQAPVEYTEKRHLRELLLLALRIATLILLALAFARPFFASGAALASSGVTLVAVDTSASLSAPGQFDRARRLAKDAIAGAPACLLEVGHDDDRAAPSLEGLRCRAERSAVPRGAKSRRRGVDRRQCQRAIGRRPGDQVRDVRKQDDADQIAGPRVGDRILREPSRAVELPGRRQAGGGVDRDQRDTR